MKVPKTFVPENKEGLVERLLDKNIGRLLKKTTPEKIKEALEDYIGEREQTRHIHKAPELFDFLQTTDLDSYLKNLHYSQLKGELPVIRVLSEHKEGVNRANYDLYWNPGKEMLEFDWDDTPGTEQRYIDWQIEVGFYGHNSG